MRPSGSWVPRPDRTEPWAPLPPVRELLPARVAAHAPAKLFTSVSYLPAQLVSLTGNMRTTSR